MPSDDFFSGFLYGLNLTDLAIPFGFLMWSLIFLVNLSRVDCTSPILVSMYLAFAAASGIVLIIIIPEDYTGRFSFKAQATLISLCTFLAGCRCLIEAVRSTRKKQAE